MLTPLRLFEQKFVGDLTDYERSVLRHGALWFFLVLASYYILRPIREQISSTYGIQNLSWLFWATFTVMLVAIPSYSVLVGRFHRKTLVPCIYFFFIATLLGFFAAMRYYADDGRAEGAPNAAGIWIARAFFIWISVYGLFIVSFFWSVIGDMLSTTQGRKIFGVMAGVGTIGSLVGSQIASQLVERIGIANLLLFPVIFLALGLVVYASLERSYSKLATESVEAKSGKGTGGNPFAGFIAVFESRYLMAICLFGLMLATCGTTIYFQQAEIVEATFTTDEAKTEYFANVNFWVSIVTLVFQFVIVGWLMKNVGLGWTLAMLPLAYILGITALALSPTIAVLAVISVTGRSAEYGICNPAREVLFTAVKREDRYKAKSFIDTVVRRGGDSMIGTVYQGLRESMAMSALSWLAVPIAVVWTGLALFIGRENRRVANQDSDKAES